MDKSKLQNLMSKITEERDEMAFSDLFDFMAPKINAYYIQNGIKTDVAEEITQEVLSTVWSKSDKYDPSKSSVSTWIYTIARNKKVDFYRKNSKFDYDEDDIREFLYKDNTNNKVNEYEINDQIKKINQKLEPEQQKIIKMNFFENKSHKIIAQELEIPLGTVKSRIRNILTKIQKLL